MASVTRSHDTRVDETFEDLRPLLSSIAYRMLGSVSEAEDVVQEAYLRHHRALAAGTEIESDRAFLSTVTTRLAIDALRSARARRETYVGEWLPEPLLTDSSAVDAATAAEQADSLSMAFLLVLERLSPVERAVFLLRDVFDYGFDEVAAVVGKSEGNCRQLAVRARRRVEAERPRFEASRRKREELAARFFAAADDGDLAGLVELLAADVVVSGDAGGTSPSWPRPIVGRERVARLLVGLTRHAADLALVLRPTEVNGQPGAVVLAPDGGLVYALSLEIADGVVQTVRSVRNPDKLRHLGAIADHRGLLRERAERRAGP